MKIKNDKEKGEKIKANPRSKRKNQIIEDENGINQENSINSNLGLNETRKPKIHSSLETTKPRFDQKIQNALNKISSLQHLEKDNFKMKDGKNQIFKMPLPFLITENIQRKNEEMIISNFQNQNEFDQSSTINLEFENSNQNTNLPRLSNENTNNQTNNFQIQFQQSNPFNSFQSSLTTGDDNSIDFFRPQEDSMHKNIFAQFPLQFDQNIFSESFEYNPTRDSENFFDQQQSQSNQMKENLRLQNENEKLKKQIQSLQRQKIEQNQLARVLLNQILPTRTKKAGNMFFYFSFEKNQDSKYLYNPKQERIIFASELICLLMGLPPNLVVGKTHHEFAVEYSQNSLELYDKVRKKKMLFFSQSFH